MKKCLSCFIVLFFCVPLFSQIESTKIEPQSASFFSNRLFIPNNSYLINSSENLFEQSVIPGAERIEVFYQKLKNKNVAVFVNQTSIVRTKDSNLYLHLIDTLLSLGIKVKKIFIPEHGFMGQEEAGESVKSYVDKKNKIEFISLYGQKKSPDFKDLEDIDVLLFDIQDVGIRFYTYISSLEYLMKAAIKYRKEFIILDRPNPNGFYVDGPVLSSGYKSFVGMQSVPIVYGMTIGEYANMLYFENLITSKETQDSTLGLSDDKKIEFSMSIVLCLNYNHKSKYKLPIKPSPNLSSMQAIYLYPSICLFEGTNVSLGRGTDLSFQCYGYPEYKSAESNVFTFIPKSRSSAKKPLFANQVCRGENLSTYNLNMQDSASSYFSLQWLMNAYDKHPQKSNFFIKDFFNLLVGNNELIKQIKLQRNEESIKETWQKDINDFLLIRSKYLLYEDF